MLVGVLAGPTASGKSAIALRLATHNGFALLNADSRQLVRGMRIGTAAPDAAQLAQAPHHLFGCLSPHETLSPRRYRDLALQALASESRPVLAVGGSGLYLKELLQPGAERGEVPPEVRAEAAARVQAQGAAAVHAWLYERDPRGLAGVHPEDGYRVAKRLEHHLAHGTSYAEGFTSARAPAFADLPVFILERPREELHARIEARLQAMLAEGWLDEVRALMAELGTSQPWETWPALQAVGYRELADYLTAHPAARTVPAALGQALLARTRQYAKRQIAFFKSQLTAPVFSVSAARLEQALETASWNWGRFLAEWPATRLASNPPIHPDSSRQAPFSPGHA